MHRPASQKPVRTLLLPRVKNASGKLVITAILTVAVAAAGTAWWYRYNATRRSAAFWGPEATRLVRDAPHVEFLLLHHHDGMVRDNVTRARLDLAGLDYDVVRSCDISKARGLTHLRNALLEDQSYEWAEQPDVPDDEWLSAIRFQENSSRQLLVLFSLQDQLGKWMEGDDEIHTMSCRPIGKGLDEMFLEFSAGELIPVSQERD
jgi:hypothetical protein